MPDLRHLALPLLLPLLTGCATLSQFAALQDVDFALDRLASVRVAGIDVTDVRSVDDLSFTEAATLATAAGRRDLPLSLRIDVAARNPDANATDARLMRLDWTLLLEGRETVSGVFAEEILLPRGRTTTFPVDVSLDLFDFFEGSGPELLELAASLAGVGGEPKNLELRARPTIQTPLGPITYPSDVRIVGGTLGN